MYSGRQTKSKIAWETVDVVVKIAANDRDIWASAIARTDRSCAYLSIQATIVPLLSSSGLGSKVFPLASRVKISFIKGARNTAPRSPYRLTLLTAGRKRAIRSR